ncbi:unnamed protein product [Allacma fusca]|uniref:RIMS-binding protein 2 n=1 Tax=Allacma fusca TaxID=39272 RepID=A0A8J2NXD4_9HEXA|nr:unnamed protein product [Allacma fusca]
MRGRSVLIFIKKQAKGAPSTEAWRWADSSKVSILESILKQLREASEQRKELERQHAEALAQLREKKDEVNRLARLSENDKKKSVDTIETLQSKIRELEKKTELQNVRHEELMLELAALKRTQQSVRASSSRPSSLGHSPPDSPICSTPDSVLSRGESTTALSTPVVPSLDAILEQERLSQYPSPGIFSRGSSELGKSLHHESMLELHDSSFSAVCSSSLVATGVLSYSLPRTHKSSFSPLRHGRKRLRRSTSVTDLTQHKPLLSKSLQFDDPIASSNEIERIIAKIQQDNKILAELDKNTVSGCTSRDLAGLYDQHQQHQHHHHQQQQQQHQQQQQQQIGGSHQTTTVQTLQSLGSVQPFQQIATVLPTNFFPVIPAGTIFPSAGPTLQSSHNQQLNPHSNNPGSSHNPLNLVAHQNQPISIPTIITTSHVDDPKSSKTGGRQQNNQTNYGMEYSNQTQQNQGGGNEQEGGYLLLLGSVQHQPNQPQVINGSNVIIGKNPHHQHHQTHHSSHSHHPHQHQQSMNKGVDVLDIPGKGRCFVYIARYSYDPFHQSPNENPEAELYLNAGDYVLVWGTMDEDGFLDGELLDGRRGLVPSNYVERLVGEDLLEFHQQVVLGIKESDDCLSTSLHDFDYPRDVQDESQRLIIVKSKNRIKRTLPPLVCNQQDVFRNREELMNRRQEEYGYLDLEDVLDDDSDPEKHVPPPVQLTLERQLNKSILIGWNPPDCPPGTVESYQVYVNGLLRCTVKANERTRALVEGVDCNRPHRISVRSVTPNRRTSRDAACTMVIGKDAPLAPSCVRATNVTSTSAAISWLPSNSNYQHVVCVNNVEVRTVKPGVYRHTITGLTPNTTYRVTVRSKNIKAPHFDEKNCKQMEKLSSHTEFRTLPKGLPDPPVDVQVEAGPQDNTILVTWHPVTAGTSNGAVVTGYAVFADGRKILEIDSPSGDHALLDLNRFQGVIPKQVTVRTKSRDSLSSDSIPISIPAQVLKGKRHNKINSNSLPRRGRHPNMLEGEESFSDRETGGAGYHMNIPSIEVTKDTDRHGRLAGHPRDYGARGRPLPPDRPVTARGFHGHPPPPGPHHRGTRPPHMDEYGRGPSAEPLYGRGRPPRPGPRAADVRHRVFVALFDYDPPTMSPNPDACEEELPFREGQMIKIYGEKDPDGFYWGEAGGRRGYVPCNMVSECQTDDDRVAQEILNESGEPLVSGRERRAMGRDRWGDIYANMPVKKMVALYDYDPQELSPNVDSEVELSFQTGDIIYVYGDMDDDGFYMGELNGVRGLVPSNFLTEAPLEYDSGGRGGRRGPPPHLGPPEHRRGPGPGARGPPPPPRDGPPPHGGLPHHRMDGRNPRKDASYPLDHSELRNHYDGSANSRRGGRGGGVGPGRRPGVPGSHMQSSPGPPGSNMIGSDTSGGVGGGGSGGGSMKKNVRGVPQVVPEFSPTTEPLPPPLENVSGGATSAIPNPLGLFNKANPLSGAGAAGNPQGPGGVGAAGTSANTNPLAGKLPGVFSETPNFMQKFTEFTNSARENTGDSILSKGKELIFKKFGL